MHRITPVLVALALVGGACGAGLESEAEIVVAPTFAETASIETASIETASIETGVASYEPQLVATATKAVDVLDGPGGSPVATLAAATLFGSPTTMLVVGGQPGWLQVSLPVEPNGQTGWVTADSVSLAKVHHRVEVDIAARELVVFDRGVELLRTTVAVGSAENPTPTGAVAFVTDALRTPSGESAYGPFALGLSIYSETLSEFAGGEGQIGIHGTNDPTSIGQAVSHGCIRVPNAVVTQLAEILPLGTPVVIR